MTNKFNVQVLKPFGPRMIKSKVPSEMVNMLNVYCDEITEMKDMREMNDMKEMKDMIK